MKDLVILKSGELNYDSDIAQASVHLDSLVKNTLDYSPWPSYPYEPAVQFAIAYSSNCIFLKYYVNEKNIRAVNNTTNSSVWEDSCVEFFISFDDEGYYNLEFNCIGTALVGFGRDKENCSLLPGEVVNGIKTKSFIQRLGKDENIYWELTLSVPLTTFVHHQPIMLQGKHCKANFYKCGDLLPEPHFISWSNIESAEPNFHLPEFFGKIVFA